MKSTFLKFIKWNLMSFVGITAITLISIPLYLKGLNSRDFAYLVLIWTAISLSTVLDFGFSRILTQKISSLINTKRIDRVKVIIGNCLLIIILLSVFVSVFISFGFNIYILNYTSGKYSQSSNILAIGIIAFCTISSQMMLSILDGLQEIKKSSFDRVLISTLYTLMPALLIHQNLNFDINTVINILCAAKIITLGIIFNKFYIYLKFIRYGLFIKIFKTYLTQGKWLMISSLSGILLNQSDRFFLGSLVTPKNLISYSISADLVQRGISLLAIISGSLLPVISGIKGSNNSSEKFSHLMMLVVSSFGAITSYFLIHYFLIWWLGVSYDSQIELIFKIMLVGWIAAGYGQLYITKIQSNGDMKEIGRLHFIEVLVFIPVIYFAIKFFGVIGAAFAWNLRVIIDTILLKSIAKNS